jgi:spermidine/putrescine transport system substrate-binding protein
VNLGLRDSAGGEEQAITMTSPETNPMRTVLTRRRVLAAGALAGFGAFLAACGTGGSKQSAAPSAEATAAPSAPAGATASAEASAPAAAQTPSAEVDWANWTYYMDYDDATKKYPSLDAFTAEYGTKVNYSEVIDDNNSFFGTIKPALEAGQSTGWDIVTLTDWMAARLIRLGWTEELDLANMPDFVANLKDIYKGLDWDPEMKHHAPWQSGMTGLGFDKDVTGDLTNLDTLYTADPKWNGKVDYLSEMRDAVGLSMLKLGLDPANPTTAGCDQATALMQKSVDDGIVRAFKGNAYAEDLKSGDAVLAMAWSGDMVQALIDKPSLRFAVASQGGMLWTDNSMIPKGALHKYTAELLMNYYYRPEVAALVTAYVNYLTPVKGADQILLKDNPDIANNPLIFPPADVVSRLHTFGALSEADEAYFNEAFAKVSGV